MAQQPIYAPLGFGLRPGDEPALLTVEQFFEAHLASGNEERAAL